MPSWTLKKHFSFEASHRLPNHDGKCARLHGHSWKGIITVAGDELLGGAKAGMLIDYGDLSTAIKPIVENYLDHYHLNDSLELLNPTSEEIARWIYRRLQTTAPIALQSLLLSVTILETCTSEATYRLPSSYQW